MEPFFQQLADPKTALQPLTEMHLPMFKTKECRCRSRPLAPNFNVAGSSPQQSMIQTERLHPHQKSPSTCTTLKLGGTREACHPIRPTLQCFPLKSGNDWITTSNPNATYLGLEPQSPKRPQDKDGAALTDALYCFKISCHILFPIPNLFRILFRILF